MTSASASIRLVTSAAERVVVAELDLVGDHGVVLVDHRDHAQAEQRAQRRARVEVALPVGHVGVGEQHLGAVQAVAAEAALVALREAHLADRGGGLQLVHGVRAPRPAKALHALGDRPARDQDRFLPRACGARATCAAQRPMAAASSPRPSFVTSDEPTFTTSVFASRIISQSSRATAFTTAAQPVAAQGGDFEPGALPSQARERAPDARRPDPRPRRSC